jgi:hypothetical protein
MSRGLLVSPVVVVVVVVVAGFSFSPGYREHSTILDHPRRWRTQNRIRTRDTRTL